MIRKKLLDPHRVRGIDGGFSFIPHRFLTDGFLAEFNAGFSQNTQRTYRSYLRAFLSYL